MPTGPFTRVAVVASATVRAAFSGWGAVGLSIAALVYPLATLAIALAHFSGVDDLAAAETLYSALFLPVVLLLVALVLGVGLFRQELEEDTLVYPLLRSLPRPSFVIGKYVGYLVAALSVLLPSALLGTAIAAAAGPSAVTRSGGLVEALVGTTVLAVIAYGAYFLLLGLVTRQAVILGLLYGFLWETFVSQITGPIQQLTVVYYLRGLGARLAPDGPLASGPSAVTLAGALEGLLASAAVSVLLAILVLRFVEARPGAAPE